MKKKIKKLQAMGHSCYEYWAPKIYGRIFSIKEGVIYFGKYHHKDEVLAKFLDIGDWVGINNDKMVILTKTTLPLDVAQKKYTDILRYRHLAYLTTDLKETIVLRGKIVALLREFLTQNDFIEVDCPLLHPFQGESTSDPFFTLAKSSSKSFSLASSPELYLKKLLVGGFDRVFTVGKLFRDELPDKTHLMEFLECEFYMTGVDYNYMMGFTEKLVEYILRKTVGKSKILYQGKILDFTPPWDKLSIHQALKQHFGEDIYSKSLSEVRKLAEKTGLVKKYASKGNYIIKLFDILFGDKIVQPTHVFDHPKDASVMCYDITMAKDKRGEEGILERFETFVNGMELTNCYSELNDPLKQRKAFDLFLARSSKRGKLKMDEQFDTAMRVGMPPASGVGMGIDRLVMLIANKKDIHEVIPFSTFHETE